MAELKPDDKSFAEKLQQWPKQVKEYIESLQLEMKRVTWPTRKQVEATTAVVILTIFAFGAFFAVVDEVLGRALASVQKAFTK